jgi:hypothetical protein
MSDSRNYTTADELKFLDALKRKNVTAFNSYRAGFNSRANWGDVDKEAVAEFLDIKPRKSGE